MPKTEIRLAPVLANLIPLEEFIRECPFLDGNEKNHALLVSTEYFDNIARYGKCFVPYRVSICVSKENGQVQIVMKYRTGNFLEMVSAVGTTEPHYDAVDDRYRGLGLLMCKNLSTNIEYKKGLFKSSIIIIL